MRKLEKFRITREDLIEAVKLAHEGMPIGKICEKIGISLVAFTKLRKQDALFNQMFNAARETGLENLADGLMDIHERIDDPIKARIASENHRWLLSKRIPKIYGDRIDVNVNQTISIVDALNDARGRSQINAPKFKDVNSPSNPTEDYFDVEIVADEDDDIFS